MDDTWSFAFLLVPGHTLHLTSISDVQVAQNGSIWLTVVLSDNTGLLARTERDIVVPTSRVTASVNVAHIVVAYETADT